MTFTLLIVVVHVFAAIAMVAGILARDLTRRELNKVDDLPRYLTLLDLVGRFDRFLAQPGSLVLAASGITLAFLEGYPLLGILQGGEVNWLLLSNLLVISIIALIVLVFIPSGKQFEQVLTEAQAEGKVTPALHNFDRAPLQVWAHRWELGATAGVIFLMITKPL